VLNVSKKKKKESIDVPNRLNSEKDFLDKNHNFQIQRDLANHRILLIYFTLGKMRFRVRKKKMLPSYPTPK
jgi:hypothetical protein